MSLKIKIPRAGPSQVGEPRPKVSKRRQAAIYSSDDEDGVQAAPSIAKAHKRARTEERSSPEGAGADIDVEADDDDVNVEDELPEDTRFLPPDLAVSKTATKRSAGSSVPRKSRPPARKSKKRAVVLSEEDEEDEAYREDVDVVNDEGDDDFEPEEASTQKKAAVRLKLKGPKARDDPKINARDERLLASSTSRASSVKRRLSVDEGDGEYGTPKVVQKEKDATPPILKKRKLPPIKKNKPTNGTSTNSSTPGATPAPARPPMKPLVDERDSLALPVAGARKTAATANNADFDLRDKSVYASLFMKPGGSTPNSGLNRKEKEEERRKELNKMRDEARAKRTSEAKECFDLQAAQEKIQRFETKLHNRQSISMFPNILGAAFKDSYERSKRPPRGPDHPPR